MHTKITYKGFENDEGLDSMLLYMYGKCAAVAAAHEVLGKTSISGHSVMDYFDFRIWFTWL